MEKYKPLEKIENVKTGHELAIQHLQGEIAHSEGWHDDRRERLEQIDKQIASLNVEKEQLLMFEQSRLERIKSFTEAIEKLKA